MEVGRNLPYAGRLRRKSASQFAVSNIKAPSADSSSEPGSGTLTGGGGGVDGDPPPPTGG